MITLTNRKNGTTITSNLTNAAALEICGNSNNSFGRDLARSARNSRYGLSDAQWFWVHKIAIELGAPAASAPAAAPVAAPVAVAPRLAAIWAMFPQGRKRGKIRLRANNKPLILSLAGANSRYKGQILVTNGGDYGSNTYYGRIDMQGNFIANNTVVTQDIHNLLESFADNPAAVAAAYGQKYGECCFCGLQLTDDRSTSVGYGPICADQRGLAWG